MAVSRRQLLTSLTAGVAWTAACRNAERPAQEAPGASGALRLANGDVDWSAVRALFPLASGWTHLASFLFVSHPKPVAEAIDRFRHKLDADPLWLEAAAFSDAEGRPFAAIKKSLADYTGGKPEEICLTSNTTVALAMAYQGLRIRGDQEILTTEHDHYSHHESIRLSAERSGARVKYAALYDKPVDARTSEIVERLARAITPKTRAVGVTWVHSSTGVKIPIAPIADAVARANQGRAPADRCLLIVDGVHGFGNQDVDVAKLGCDFFASGTHKWLFAPRGTGFLWGRADVWPELRPTIPTFDPDAPETWDAWMNRTPLPPTTAKFVSPGGFYAFEHLLAIPAAVELHHTIGRDRIATRLRDLSGSFREELSRVKGVTLHTPRDSELSGGLTCFEVAGLTPEKVDERLAEKKIRTNHTPYKTSYARVALGVMNSPADVETAVKGIRELVS